MSSVETGANSVNAGASRSAGAVAHSASGCPGSCTTSPRVRERIPTGTCGGLELFARPVTMFIVFQSFRPSFPADCRRA